jgi:hypothetical protein
VSLLSSAARGLSLLAVPTFLAAQTPLTGGIVGRVMARPDTGAVGSETLLAGATASVIANGRTVNQATTDSAGSFTLSNVPAGRETLRVHRLGYRTLDRAIVVLPNDTLHLSIVLEPEAQQLTPVRTVAPQADVESFTARPNVATIAMSARSMANVPNVGEPDVLRVMQLLPGVAARNDFTAGLNVRGGSADQNLVLLDGIPIYNPYHLGGLFSTFMDATVGGIELMTGAFPARYDGRLSSVLDVRSSDETRPGVHTTTEVSLLAATGRLAGGFADGRGSWSFAARRTYADAAASVFSSDHLPYHFLDMQGHATYLLPNEWRVALTGYAGHDVLDLNLASFGNDSTVSRAGEGTWEYNWGNRVLGATLAKEFNTPPLGWLLGKSTTLEQRVSTSGFSTRLDLAEGASTQRSEIHDLRAGGSLTARGDRNDRSLGYDVSTTHVRYSSISAQTGTTSFDIIQDPISYAGWVSDLWRLTPSLMVESGLRGEILTGPREWAALSPRLSIKYFATPTLAFTAAAGRVTQTLHSLVNDGPLRFFDVWLASDQHIPVETAWHYVLGAERRVAATSVRLEGYVKQYDRVLDANVSEDPSRRGDEFSAGTGLAYGADLLVRWQPRSGPTGWIAYSYGVVSHDSDGVRWWPGNDRRHDLNVVATWRLARYRLGARFGFASGTPYTPIVGQVVRRVYNPGDDGWDTDSPTVFVEPLGGARNSARFPATQRLDLDVSRDINYRGALIAPYLSVVNAYNAQNIFVYIYDYSTDRPTRRGYTQFPILPSVGVRVAF